MQWLHTFLRSLEGYDWLERALFLFLVLHAAYGLIRFPGN
jgi:hypothetical protein